MKPLPIGRPPGFVAVWDIRPVTKHFDARIP